MRVCTSVVALSILLASCGSGSDPLPAASDSATNPTPDPVSTTPDATPAPTPVADAPWIELLDLDTQWRDWNGNDIGATFESVTGFVSVPAAPDNSRENRFAVMPRLAANFQAGDYVFSDDEAGAHRTVTGLTGYTLDRSIQPHAFNQAVLARLEDPCP